MPVYCKFDPVKSKYRVLERESGRIARNRGGTPVDGGGHSTFTQCRKQAQAINISIHNRSE